MNTNKKAKKHLHPATIGLLICLLIITAVFSLSLFRSWIFYDEDVIYNELFAPIPTSFSETIEILNNFGLINNIGSNNFLYSSNIANRTSLFGTPLLMLLGLLFSKNAVLYHLANLVFHLLNSTMVFLILKKIFQSNLSAFTLSLLTLFWALHPVQIESILLSTNIGATISYTFFFLLFYDFLKNKGATPSIQRKIIIPIVFIMPMLLNEYIIALPFIILTLSLFSNLSKNKLVAAIKQTFNECLPYLIGILIYLLYFLFSNYGFFQTIKSNLNITIQRILWLSPQIIMHNLKLIFFPITLSIDQSAHVKISNSLWAAYPILCTATLFALLFIPLAIFLLKRKCFLFTLYSWLILISFIPFVHILSPTYAISAERYLYTPLFFITLAIGIAATRFIKSNDAQKIFLTIFSCLLCILVIRSVVRMGDWKNNESILQATIQSSPNKLYKAQRTQDLARIYNNIGETEKSAPLHKKANQLLQDTIKEYELKEKNNSTYEPLILKAYGLDAHSLLLKAGYKKYHDQFLQDRSNIDACLKFFNATIDDVNSLDPATLELYANLILAKGDKDKAKDLFLLAHEKYPTVPFILVSLIRFERDIESNLQATKQYVEKARKLFPYSKDILFEALRYHQSAGNFKEYVDHAYLYGLRAHSKFTYLEALTGYLQLNIRDKAKLTIDKLLRLDPTDPKIFYMASHFHIKEQDYEKAIALLQEGKMNLKDKEDDDLAFKINSTLAELHYVQNNYGQAIFYAQEALKYAYGNPGNIAKVKELITKLEI